MKSLKEYALNISEEAYHALPAWSYSIIAKYARNGFSSLRTLHNKTVPTSAMEFGSLFDSIITRQESLDDYVVCDMSIPDAEKKALDYIVSRTDKPHASLEELHTDDFMTYCNECQYQVRWGYDARLKHLVPYSAYYDIKRTGRIPVSKTDWDDAVAMRDAFYSNDCLKKYFGINSTKDVEYIYQPQFVTEYSPFGGKTTVPLKMMADLMVVNHKDKTVQLIDVKTISQPAYDFADNFVRFRYDIQASMYSDIILAIMTKSGIYKDYTVLPFMFAAISRTDKVPVTYVYDPADYSQINGLSFKDYQYKDWRKLLEEIITYEEENAKVPSNIKADAPNDIITLLNS